MIRRSRIVRRTPLKRGSKPIPRRVRPRQRSKSSRASLIRACSELWSWRIRERDAHVCLTCRAIGTDAHHIYGKKAFPGVRFDLANGVALCRRCHDAAHAKPVAFLLEMQDRMGEGFDRLRAKALRVKAVDLREVRVSLEAA